MQTEHDDPLSVKTAPNLFDEKGKKQLNTCSSHMFIQKHCWVLYESHAFLFTVAMNSQNNETNHTAENHQYACSACVILFHAYINKLAYVRTLSCLIISVHSLVFYVYVFASFASIYQAHTKRSPSFQNFNLSRLILPLPYSDTCLRHFRSILKRSRLHILLLYSLCESRHASFYSPLCMQCKLWTCMCKFKLKDSMEYYDDEDFPIDIMIIIFRALNSHLHIYTSVFELQQLFFS